MLFSFLVDYQGGFRGRGRGGGGGGGGWILNVGVDALEVDAFDI